MPGPDVNIPGTVPPDVLKAAFRHHAAGVTVVTADAGDGPLALTASSVTSVSSSPAILLFSVTATTATGRAIARASSAVVHLLDVDDLDLAIRCADPTVDRFADPSAWERLASGEPVFLGPRMLLRGDVVQRIVLGEAVVIVLAVVEVIDRGPRSTDGGTPAAARPLAYHDRRWHALGEDSRLDPGRMPRPAAQDPGPRQKD